MSDTFAKRQQEEYQEADRRDCQLKSTESCFGSLPFVLKNNQKRKREAAFSSGLLSEVVNHLTFIKQRNFFQTSSQESLCSMKNYFCLFL